MPPCFCGLEADDTRSGCPGCLPRVQAWLPQPVVDQVRCCTACFSLCKACLLCASEARGTSCRKLLVSTPAVTAARCTGSAGSAHDLLVPSGPKQLHNRRHGSCEGAHCTVRSVCKRVCGFDCTDRSSVPHNVMQVPRTTCSIADTTRMELLGARGPRARPAAASAQPCSPALRGALRLAGSRLRSAACCALVRRYEGAWLSP